VKLKLEESDISKLKATGWKPPERFKAKARDGKTDIYGVLWRPTNFDPSKKYAIVENIYTGPHSSYTPTGFAAYRHGCQSTAELGFLCIMIEGMGTNHRGKAFHIVSYKNLGDGGLDDRIGAMRQLAEKYTYMDLSRVGVYGHSWGGHFALRALLLAPDVYHVGIASAPDVDLYDHTYGEVELYMGLPQNNREGYDYGSNLWLAGNLKGKLLLIHGTSDVHVPFSATMKMVEALIRAGKPYDLIVLPDQAHGFTGTSANYAREAIRRYFQEHLKP